MLHFAATARTALIRANKLLRLMRRSSYWAPLRHGVAAGVEHEAVPFRDDIATVLDVGASRGQFALFAQRRFPAAHIVCFEPLPQSRALLTKVLGPAVEVHGVALGAVRGEATLHLSAAADSSSLLPITRRQTQEFPGSQESGRLGVRVECLDDMVTTVIRPSLLKLDVQGFELEVLTGGERVLDEVDEVYVECSFTELYEGQPLADEVIYHLRERGLRLIGAYGVTQSVHGACLQADLLFRRR